MSSNLLFSSQGKKLGPSSLKKRKPTEPVDSSSEDEAANSIEPTHDSGSTRTESSQNNANDNEVRKFCDINSSSLLFRKAFFVKCKKKKWPQTRIVSAGLRKRLREETVSGDGSAGAFDTSRKRHRKNSDTKSPNVVTKQKSIMVKKPKKEKIIRYCAFCNKELNEDIGGKYCSEASQVLLFSMVTHFFFLFFYFF
ncbi:hypothetical protein RFI_18486, partial [Reticulomyxa filosa]